MGKCIYVNGEWLPRAEAHISVRDQGFLLGDGVFTTMRVTDGRLETFERHMNRLKEQCTALHITPPELGLDVLKELLFRNEAEKGVWRVKVIVSGGIHSLLERHVREPATLIAIATRELLPLRKTAILGISKDLCLRPSAQLKTLSYLDRQLLLHQAQKRDFDDLILLDQNANVLETVYSNLFWVHKQELYTPCSELPLYSGTSIELVIKAAEQLSWQCHRVRCTINEIPTDAQLFSCNSMRHLLPIISVEKQDFQRNDDVEIPLMETFQSLVLEESSDCFEQIDRPYTRLS
jgi:4-amino-4-deoxychorismate lyase